VTLDTHPESELFKAMRYKREECPHYQKMWDKERVYHYCKKNDRQCDLHCEEDKDGN